MTIAEVFAKDHLWQLIIGLFAGGGIGSIISARLAARKSNLDELKAIIEQQRVYIEKLEARLDRLNERVNKLECENDALRQELCK